MKIGEGFKMTLWMFLLILFGILITIGFLADLIAKKRNLRFDPDERLKHASESERILKELYLKQIGDNLHNLHNPHL
jgi:hypothetical protein